MSHPLSNLYRRGKQGERVPVPPPLSLSFLMLMGVRSSIPGTICPSSGFGPQALQTCPIVCVCPSRKWWAGMVLVAQKAPPSTARACCSLAYMWQREGGGGRAARVPCAQQHQGPPPFVPLRVLHRFYVRCPCWVTVWLRGWIHRSARSLKQIITEILWQQMIF